MECRIRTILFPGHAEFWRGRLFLPRPSALEGYSERCESSFEAHVQFRIGNRRSAILQFFGTEAGGKQGRRAADDSETIENPASNFRGLNGRDDPHGSATVRAFQDVEFEGSRYELRPGVVLPGRLRVIDVRSVRTLFRWRIRDNVTSPFCGWCQDAVIVNDVIARSRNQRGQPRRWRGR
jgi:hypothetical protein